MLHYPKSRDEWLKLRHSCVSSTEVAALHGLSPYLTAFELACLKRAEIPDDREIGERATWGLRMQSAAAAGLAEDLKIKVRALNAYAIQDGTRMGASFDYEIIGTEPGSEFEDYYKRLGTGILEIKTVDALVYRNDWQDGEAPAHVEIQVQGQLECIERAWAIIGVVVGGNKGVHLLRERDLEVGAALRRKVQEFWMLLEAGGMPPVVLPDDVEIIRRLYSYAEPGNLLDANGNDEIKSLCAEYAAAGEDEKAASARKDTARAKLLQMIGTAEKVLCDGYTISCGLVSEAEIPAYTRRGYRNFRITQKRAKA
jgi:putative phage-type endonuclease